MPFFSNAALLDGTFILASIGLAIALFVIISRLYAYLTRQPIQHEMCRFGFSFLPIALMGHIGHNLGHLLTGYQFVPGALLGLLGRAPSIPIEGSPDSWFTLVLKIGLIMIGFGMSMWALRGVCNSGRIICPRQPAAIPYVGLSVIFASAYILMFTLPMAARL